MPRPTALDPLLDVLPAGTSLLRVYHRHRGPLAFNPTDAEGRFRPVFYRAQGQRLVVPTAYLADDDETALAEGVLRGVTALEKTGVRRRLYRVQLDGLAMHRLRLTREVRLVRLHGLGLTRLGLLRRHVIDCDEDDYLYTAAWAQSLYGSRARPLGLSWTSRQNDSARAYIFWKPRLRDGDLELVSPELRLDREPGLDLVRQVCAAAGVDFEG